MTNVNLKSAKDRVLKKLITNPEFRNDDQKLYAAILWEDVLALKITTSAQLVISLSKGNLTHFESVRRSRQRIQQMNPHLRGHAYAKKHAKQEQIKEQLKLID